ncbi:IS1595 family transposase [Caulobacter sp. SLTY]|uniref:IS1595 family transposase n=1 Tax=Caulobacter sp. SLTY TaxID=2683262 RepID=UPI0014122E1B|nr:IS1595 family transposase [Caulobacter sp. SLTY]NBB16460.1 IS1595 family transposase [Caulobacter sp. SLTY]
MSAPLTDPIFHDEDAARAHFEALRWPNGRVCPHCGVEGNSTLMQGKTTRPGLYKCKEKECRKPFSATMGTLYEKSHIPLHKWLLATHLMCSSKKGISAHQLFRMLGFGSYRTAWFMAHRIREAMREGDLGPFGMGGATVEVDETFLGTDPDYVQEAKRGSVHGKMKVLTLVERETGRARSFVVDKLTINDIVPVVEANLSREARLMTDESKLYVEMGKAVRDHQSVKHNEGEYVRRNQPTVHTNTIEGFFSIFKRGMRGVYQHSSKKHLHRYLAEFDFRYSYRVALGVNDTQRAAIAVSNVVGKRLTYQRPQVQTAS